MKTHPLELIVEAVVWHESKLWDLYQEHQTELETNKIYREAGQ